MPLTKLIFVATSLKTCQKFKMFFLLLFLNFFQIRIRAVIETTVIKAKPHLEPNTIGTRGCFDTRHYKSNYSLKESFRFNFNKVWQINFWPPVPWQGGGGRRTGLPNYKVSLMFLTEGLLFTNRSWNFCPKNLD